MIHWLKHISVRMGLAVFLGEIISLLLLRIFPPVTNPVWAIALMLLLISLVFLLMGWLSNRIGMALIMPLIREAEVWERSQNTRRAEAIYHKAMATCNSFLLSPPVKGRLFNQITGKIVRFYLARPKKDPSSAAFLFSYLMNHPQDAEVAESWLQHTDSLESHNREHNELAIRIGNAQPANMTIQHALARFFLAEKRTDFPALQIYRRILENKNGRDVESIAAELADIFLKQGRADELSLKVYLKALKQKNNRQKLVRGIAACVHWVRRTDRTAPLLQYARQLLTRIGITLTDDMLAEFNPPVTPPAPPPKPATVKNIGRFIVGFTRRMYKIVRQTILIFAQRVAGWTQTMLAFIRGSEKAKIFLKYAAVSVLAIGVIIAMVNTISHLIPTRPGIGLNHTPEIAPVPVVTDPFTLQVAAYLKPEHAVKYETFLKKQNLDAYTIIVKGSQKTWYQVRISHFPDKNSAKAFGTSLKARKIIDDFYIANYERPQ